MTTAAGTNPSSKRELTITRVLDAPPSRVFKMWTNAKHMAQWWGPKGFTNPVCELDVRPGGAIRIHMRAPDGVVHPMTGSFREILEPERLVFTAVAEDQAGKPLLEALTTVTFAEHAGKTTLTVRASAVGLAPVAPQMLAGMEAGWTQGLQRLEDYLARTGKGA
jgi:uncharacterized protein YndB with AHSA1/START domain